MTHDITCGMYKTTRKLTDTKCDSCSEKIEKGSYYFGLWAYDVKDSVKVSIPILISGYCESCANFIAAFLEIKGLGIPTRSTKHKVSMFIKTNG